jgi:hypothetical protein
MSYGVSTGSSGAGTGGKSAGGNPNVIGGFQPTQQAQTDFSQGVANQPGPTQGGVNNIGGASAGQQALNTGTAGIDSAAQNLFNQYASVIGGAPAQSYQPMFDNRFNQAVNGAMDLYNQSAPMGMSATPMIGGQAGQQPMPTNLSLPNGQQLDLSQAAMTPQNLYNQYSTQVFGAPAQMPQMTPAMGMNQSPAMLPVQQNFLQQNAQRNAAQRTAAPAPMPTKASQGYVSRAATPARPLTGPRRVK